MSVVIPVHNRADKLKTALLSVYEQTCQPDEVIVVDDGSTDDLSLLKKKYPQVHWIHQSHQGVSAARNAGIKQASGKWIAFLDSDDRWIPEKLEKQFALLANSPHLRIIHSKEQWIRHGQEIDSEKYLTYPDGEFFLPSLEKCVVGPSTVLVERKPLEEVGGFDENLPVCEDYDLWLRIARKYPIGLCPERLTIKTGGHGDQLSTRYWGMDRFRITALKKHLDSHRYLATVLQTIITKCEVLCTGAKKRGNEDVLEVYSQEKSEAQKKLNKIVTS